MGAREGARVVWTWPGEAGMAHAGSRRLRRDLLPLVSSCPTVVIGSGVLYLPFYFSILGWIGGVIMLLTFGFITW